MLVYLTDNSFELIDLLWFDASEKDLFFLSSIHPRSLNECDAARTVFEQVFGDIRSEIANNITKFGAVDAHNKNVTRFCANKDKDECIENIFGIAQDNGAGEDDDGIKNGCPNRYAEKLEPVTYFASEQFRSAARNLEFDKDTDAYPLQYPAINGGKDTVVCQGGQVDKQFIEQGKDCNGQQTAENKLPAHLFKTKQKDRNVDEHGHQADTDSLVCDEIEESCEARYAAADDLVADEKAVYADGIQCTSDQHGSKADGFPKKDSSCFCFHVYCRSPYPPSILKKHIADEPVYPRAYVVR